MACGLLYVVKAFGHNLMETSRHSGWIIHLSFVGAADAVASKFVL